MKQKGEQQLTLLDRPVALAEVSDELVTVVCVAAVFMSGGSNQKHGAQLQLCKHRARPGKANPNSKTPTMAWMVN